MDWKTKWCASGHCWKLTPLNDRTNRYCHRGSKQQFQEFWWSWVTTDSPEVYTVSSGFCVNTVEGLVTERESCHFKVIQCHNWGRTRHIAPICRFPMMERPRFGRQLTSGGEVAYNRFKPEHCVTCNPNPSTNTNHSDGDSLDNREEFEPFNLTDLEFSRPIVGDIDINDALLPMEVDTGGAVTIISRAIWESTFPKLTFRSLK